MSQTQVPRAQVDIQRQQIGRVDLAVVTDPASPAAEAYRSLRSTVKFADTDPPTRSLLIADVTRNGQHTVVAANLAAALALGGDSTLLVDGALRQPRIHELFGLTNSEGLAEWLAAGDVGQPLPLVESGVPGLRLLLAGHAPSSMSGTGAAADLLTGDLSARLLALLRDEATFVVMDAPPLSNYGDGLAIAARVDGVLLLVRSGKTKRAAAQHAKDALDRVGARLLGAVLTDTGRGRFTRR